MLFFLITRRELKPIRKLYSTTIAQSEEEKDKTTEAYNKIFQKLKENYDNIKNYYETQKLIFSTEQQLNSSSSKRIS